MAIDKKSLFELAAAFIEQDIGKKVDAKDEFLIYKFISFLKNEEPSLRFPLNPHNLSPIEQEMFANTDEQIDVSEPLEASEVA